MIPDTPAAVDELVYVRPFTLEQPFKYVWCKERPNITTGTLLVLKVDKALVVPRDAAMPVLFVGDKPAQCINHGHKSGHVIAVVPGEVDLIKTPIWFGTPGLPYRTDKVKAQAERALATRAGIKPFAKEAVAQAQARGGERINAVDMSALLRGEVAELILKYSPDEKHLADGFRVPVVTRQKPDMPADDGD